MSNKLVLCSRCVIVICAILIVLHCCSVIFLNEVVRGIIIFIAAIAAIVNYKSSSKK